MKIFPIHQKSNKLINRTNFKKDLSVHGNAPTYVNCGIKLFPLVVPSSSIKFYINTQNFLDGFGGYGDILCGGYGEALRCVCVDYAKRVRNKMTYM